ncbi:ribbon-helix-helix domain-containing protein [Frankia sp. Cr2]|uniref:ribbon-helix-helix domain-containing protein n=1 Tax=Frankia sp. Cr2 TaxID=3073932 RepID=UPI002AD23CCD|nr:ribbon-helix-helix protein, CopG family [Frankia sp. Cr2]
MPQIAVRLDDAEVAALDTMVSSGRYHSRAEAVRAALHTQRRLEEDRMIAEAYARGYCQQPRTSDERALSTAAANLVPTILGDDGGYDLADLGLAANFGLSETP